MNSELSIQELELVAGGTYVQPSTSSANSSPFTQQIDKFQEDLAKVGLSGFAGPEGAGSSVMAKRHNIKSSTEQTAAGY